MALTEEFIKIKPDSVVPFSLGSEYESRGLKPADSLIGAFTEFVRADSLVTGNRHFLARQPGLPFKVLSAEKCLELFKP